MHYLTTSIISGLGWGIIPLFDRFSSKYVDGVTLASSRGLTFGLCAIMTFLFLLYRGKNSLPEGYKKGGKLLLAFIIISPIIGFFMGHVAYYLSLVKARSSIIQVTLIAYCLPVVIVTLFTPILYNDKINWQTILGVIVTLIGISMTVIYNPNHQITSPITS